MSGDEYGHLYEKVDEMAYRVRLRHQNDALLVAFADHLEGVAKAMKAIEWVDSGDGDDSMREKVQDVVSPRAELESALGLAKQAQYALSEAVRRARMNRW